MNMGQASGLSNKKYPPKEISFGGYFFVRTFPYGAVFSGGRRLQRFL